MEYFAETPVFENVETLRVARFDRESTVNAFIYRTISRNIYCIVEKKEKVASLRD